MLWKWEITSPKQAPTRHGKRKRLRASYCSMDFVHLPTSLKLYLRFYVPTWWKIATRNFSIKFDEKITSDGKKKRPECARFEYYNVLMLIKIRASMGPNILNFVSSKRCSRTEVRCTSRFKTWRGTQNLMKTKKKKKKTRRKIFSRQTRHFALLKGTRKISEKFQQLSGMCKGGRRFARVDKFQSILYTSLGWGFLTRVMNVYAVLDK